MAELILELLLGLILGLKIALADARSVENMDSVNRNPM